MGTIDTQAARAGAGIDLGSEESFVGVDVSKTAHQGLVQQGAFDLRVARPQPRREVFARGFDSNT